MDGFDTCDNYIYPWANKKAPVTYTDDDYYFAHRGKIDLFNFSRQPGGQDKGLPWTFVAANNLKKQFITTINNGKFVPLRTTEPSVFSYAVTYKGKNIVVTGNLNFRNNVDVTVYLPHFSVDNNVIPIKIEDSPIAKRGSFKVTLNPGETQVLLIDDLEL